MNNLGWTPRDGEQVWLYHGNKWGLPAGAYLLETFKVQGYYALRRVHGARAQREGISAALLTGAETAGTLKPLDPANYERVRQRVQLVSDAPLRSAKAQESVNDCALFAAVDSKELDL